MNIKRSVTCKANCKIVDIHPSIPIIKLKWSKYVNKWVKISESIFKNNMVIRRDTL